MYIRLAIDRRVNLEFIAVYKPYDKYIPLISEEKYYFIHIKYLDGTEEELGYVHDKDKRDQFIKLLDENLLDTSE